MTSIEQGLPGGHFWTLESPDETTAAIRELLTMEQLTRADRARAKCN